MRNYRRITLLVGLVVLGNSVSVYAQARDRFHRVTTTAQRDARTSSTANRLAATARGSAVSSSRSQADPLHPYSSRATAEAQSRESDGGNAHSTSQQEPRQIAPAPQAAAPSRSRSYYPGLRSGVAVQPPVRMTASPVMIPRTTCTPSRSQAIGGATQSSGAGAGAGHHR